MTTGRELEEYGWKKFPNYNFKNLILIIFISVFLLRELKSLVWGL